MSLCISKYSYFQTWLFLTFFTVFKFLTLPLDLISWRGGGGGDTIG